MRYNTTGIPLFVILDVWGAYYFAPSFTEWDYYTVDPSSIPRNKTVVEGFFWPPDIGQAEGLVWWAAMLDPTFSYLVSNLDTWEFGYGE